MGSYLLINFAIATGIAADAVIVTLATGPGKVSAAAQWSTAEMVWSFVLVGLTVAAYVFGSGYVAWRVFRHTTSGKVSKGNSMARWRTLFLVLETVTFASFSGLGTDRAAAELVAGWPAGACVWAALVVVAALWLRWGRRLYAGQLRAVQAERAAVGLLG